MSAIRFGSVLNQGLVVIAHSCHKPVRIRWPSSRAEGDCTRLQSAGSCCGGNISWRRREGDSIADPIDTLLNVSVWRRSGLDMSRYRVFVTTVRAFRIVEYLISRNRSAIRSEKVKRRGNDRAAAETMPPSQSSPPHELQRCAKVVW